MTFDQAKQQVAVNHGRRDWSHLTWDSDRGGYDEDEMYAEAAELYATSKAQAAANEAVKEDRVQIIERFPHPFRDENHQRMLNELPLLFPDAK